MTELYTVHCNWESNTAVTLGDYKVYIQVSSITETEMLRSAITRLRARTPLPKQFYALGQAYSCNCQAAYNPVVCAPALSVPGSTPSIAPSRHYSQYGPPGGGRGGPGGPFPSGGTYRMDMSGE